MALVLKAALPGLLCAVGALAFVAHEIWQDRRRARALDEISEVD